MITVIKIYDDLNVYGWYLAKATKLRKMASGDTKEHALRNLKNLIRTINKK